jgi:hypothetical protein
VAQLPLSLGLPSSLVHSKQSRRNIAAFQSRPQNNDECHAAYTPHHTCNKSVHKVSQTRRHLTMESSAGITMSTTTTSTTTSTTTTTTMSTTKISDVPLQSPTTDPPPSTRTTIRTQQPQPPPPPPLLYQLLWKCSRSPVGYKPKTKATVQIPSIPLGTDLASSPTKSSAKSCTIQSAVGRIRQTVSFAMQHDSIHEIELIRDMDAADIARCWWSAKEYGQIRRDYQAVVHWLETRHSASPHDDLDEQDNSDSDNDDNEMQQHCARGLHARTAAGSWTLYEHVRNARHAVLDVQDQAALPPPQRPRPPQRQQRVSSIQSPGCTTHRATTTTTTTTTTDLALTIAKAYAAETLPLRRAALDQAARDAAAVQSYLCRNKDDILAAQTRVSRETVPWPVRDHVADAVQPRGRRPSLAMAAPKVQFYDSWTSLSALKAHKLKSTTNKSPATATSDMLDAMMEPDDELSVQPAAIEITSVTPPPRVTKKCVRFSSATNVIIPGRKVNDLNKDQRRKWYSATELARIQSTVDVLVQQWEQSPASSAKNAAAAVANWLEDEHGDCGRGLEHKTKQAAEQLRHRREAALAAVLEFPSHHGSSLPPRTDEHAASLAEAYHQATRAACRDAIKLGKQDAKQAKKHRLRRRSVQCTKTEVADGITFTKIAIDSHGKQVSQCQALDQQQRKHHHRRSSCSVTVPGGGFDHQAAHRVVQQRV